MMGFGALVLGRAAWGLYTGAVPDATTMGVVNRLQARGLIQHGRGDAQDRLSGFFQLGAPLGGGDGLAAGWLARVRAFARLLTCRTGLVHGFAKLHCGIIQVLHGRLNGRLVLAFEFVL